MHRHIHSLKVVNPNKYELYLSLLIVVGAAPDFLVLPRGYADTLIACTAFSTALVCGINAILDSERMNWLERIVAFPWVGFLLLATLLMLWDTAHIQIFSNR